MPQDGIKLNPKEFHELGFICLTFTNEQRGILQRIQVALITVSLVMEVPVFKCGLSINSMVI